jgi:hypothetical protein
LEHPLYLRCKGGRAVEVAGFAISAVVVWSRGSGSCALSSSEGCRRSRYDARRGSVVEVSQVRDRLYMED